MAEKKIQENPLPETQEQDMTAKVQDKQSETTVTVPTTIVPEAPHSRLRGMLSISKTPPNDLYRRLLPAVLFLMTFVTVMTMLLIYMDTVALGAQQFRLNMSRDYELSRIDQDEPSLVAYVRQLHLTPRAQPPALSEAPEKTQRIAILDQIFGDDYNGTFVEILSSGPRDRSTRYLELVRGWRGLVARAAPRDYLALRGSSSVLHACLSPTRHPREVTYHSESSSGSSSGFRSRVLCLPLYTMLLAGSADRADYIVLGGVHAHQAVRTLPFDRVHLPVIEIRLLNSTSGDETTRYLLTHNYTVKAELEEGVVYALDSR